MKRILVIMTALAVLGAQASASVTLLSARGQVNADSTIDWGQFGPDGTPVANPAFGVTNGNVFALKAQGTGTMLRHDEGLGLFGNMAIGDKTLWTVHPGPLSIKFSRTLNAVGAQILDGDLYGTNTVKISAYDGLDTLLGSFLVSVTTTNAEDNSASFVGIRSTGGDIARVEYEFVNRASMNLNTVSLETCNVVPEPATMSLIGFGVAALAARRRKKA